MTAGGDGVTERALTAACVRCMFGKTSLALIALADIIGYGRLKFS